MRFINASMVTHVFFILPNVVLFTEKLLYIAVFEKISSCMAALELFKSKLVLEKTKFGITQFFFVVHL